MNNSKNRSMILVNYVPFFIFFALMFYFSRSATIMGDDLRYSMRSAFNYILPHERVSSIFQAFQSAYYDWTQINSRYMTSALISTVMMGGVNNVYYILNPMLLTLAFYFGLRMAKGSRFDCVRDLTINSLVLIGFFMLSPALIDETLFWITGSITYSWPMLWIVFYFWLLASDRMAEAISEKWYYQIPLVVISVYLGSLAENMSVSMTVLSLFLVLFNCVYLKNREWFKSSRKVAVISVWIANAIQLSSPGMWSRDAIAGEVSLVSRLINGFYAFIEYQYYSSGVVVAVLVLLLILFLLKISKKLVAAVFVIALPFLICSIINAIPNGFYLESYNLSYFFVTPSSCASVSEIPKWFKLLTIGYHGLLTAFIALSIVVVCVNQKNQRMFVLLVLATISNLALVFIGGAGLRTAFMADFFMTVDIGLMLHLLFDSKCGERVCGCILVCTLAIMICFSTLCLNHKLSYLGSNVQVANVRRDLLEDREKDTGVTIPLYRFTIHGNFADIGLREHIEFCDYFHIPYGELRFAPRADFGID